MARKPYWRAAEEACADEHGASLTPRSGAGFVFKADCKTADRLFETKSSQRADAGGPYIIVQAAWFRTVKAQALAIGKDPAVYLVLGVPPRSFTYGYDPFANVIPEGTVPIERTAKLSLDALASGIPALLIDGELWRHD